jgi:hypothetical protein
VGGPIAEILAANLFGGYERLRFFASIEIFPRALSVLVISGNLKSGLSLEPLSDYFQLVRTFSSSDY